MAPNTGAPRSRGTIVRRANGTYRIRVYAGFDPVTGKRNYLDETVQPGPGAAKEAEKVRTRLLNQVDEQKNPKTKSTVNQLLDRYLDLVDVDESTLKTYRGYVENHVRPVLGRLPVGRVDGEILDSFYGELRRCRRRCNRRARLIDHRTERDHACDERCKPHVCKPLAASTVRQIHWILSGAFDRAVRWRWIGVTPINSSSPPPIPRANPSPPSSDEAARIVTEAFKDPQWGLFIWLAMVTGARRGELCAVRRSHLDLAKGVLLVPSSVYGSRANMREKDTKTHQGCGKVAFHEVSSSLMGRSLCAA